MHFIYVIPFCFVSVFALSGFKDACKEFLALSDTRIGPDYPRDGICISKADNGKKGVCCITGFRKLHKVVFRKRTFREKICIVLKCEYDNDTWHWERCKCVGDKYKLSKSETKKQIPATTPKKTTPQKTTPKKTTPQKTTPKKTTPQKTTPKKTTPHKPTPKATTPKPKLDLKITTPKKKLSTFKRFQDPGCEYNGKHYELGKEIPELTGRLGKICYGAYCNNNGEIKKWRNYYCDPTTEVFLPATSAAYRLVTDKGGF